MFFLKFVIFIPCIYVAFSLGGLWANFDYKKRSISEKSLGTTDLQELCKQTTIIALPLQTVAGCLSMGMATTCSLHVPPAIAVSPADL